MIKTTLEIAALLNSRSDSSAASGAAHAAVGVASLVVYGLMALLVLLMPVFFGVGHLSMEKEIIRYSQAPEKSFAVDAAKFYRSAIPQAAFDAYAALPKAKLQKGEPNYTPGVGINADFQNAKWGLLAIYYLAACLFFALQLGIIFCVMFVFARVWAPLVCLPFFAAIVHYAMPFYFLHHFKYLRYVVQ